MLQYFKLGSWDRLILLLLAALLLQAPFFFFPPEILVPELLRIRLGEKLADGWRLYAQIQDETGPLAAMVYAAMAKAGILYPGGLRAAAFLLILAQAFYLNNLVHNLQLVTDRHYLVAFFYLVFSHLGPDSQSLSPVLLGNTFHLFALGRFFRLLKEGSGQDNSMILGLWLGLAALCYPPMGLLVLALLVSALFFTGLRPNQFLVAILAVILPWASVYPFYLLGGGEQEFFICLLAHFEPGFRESWTGWDIYLSLAAFLLLIALAGWAAGNLNSRVNLQRMGFMVFFFSLINGFLILFLGTVRTTENLLVLLPHAAFFATQFFLFTRGILMQEMVNLFVCGIFLSVFYGLSDAGFGTRIFHHQLLAGKPPKGFQANFKGPPIMVLANDPRFFLHNPCATRYLRFYLNPVQSRLSQTHEGLIFWYQILAEDPPRLIYDPDNLIPAVALRIPEFGRCYRATFYPRLYEAIPGAAFGKP